MEKGILAAKRRKNRKSEGGNLAAKKRRGTGILQEETEVTEGGGAHLVGTAHGRRATPPSAERGSVTRSTTENRDALASCPRARRQHKGETWLRKNAEGPEFYRRKQR